MSDYLKHLEGVHAKWNTPDSIIQSVVKNATTKDLVNKRRIIAGEANEVYDITLEGHENVIVRISRYSDAFEGEKWAIDQCLKQGGIPVPEVRLITKQSVGDQELGFCVQTKLPGDTLERGSIDFHNFKEIRRRRIINQAGEVLAKIHSIKTSGFGDLDGDGNTDYVTIDELIKNRLSKIDDYLEIAQNIDLQSDVIRQIFNTIDRVGHQFGGIQPVLNHDDFNPKHIMVDENDQITGIIDWGEVKGASAVNDFARWDYWYSESVPIKWLIEGYTNKALFDASYKDLLHFLKLETGLGVLGWYHSQGYKLGIDRAVKKLVADMEYFK